MTNVDKAARVIRDLSEVDGMTIGYAHAHNIAMALKDAGLLAPEPLSPTFIDDEGKPEWEITWDERLWSKVENGRVWHGGKHLHHLVARHAAYALLAAADYAEQEQK